MKDGVVMLAGINDGIAGIRAAVDVGAAWNLPYPPPLLQRCDLKEYDSVSVLNEAESKKLLASFGVPVPEGRVIRDAVEAASAAEELGYPVVIKAVGIPHKTEVGGVKLNLHNSDQVSAAVKGLLELSESCLIEKMVEGVVAELIVGVACDEQFGPYLLVGGGGILVELMKDSASLLLPITKEHVTQALSQLKCAPLLNGFRGAPPADIDAVIEVIMAVASMVEDSPSSINELYINPLMVRAKGQGVVAADALISLNG